jgi:hypothetical protein
MPQYVFACRGVKGARLRRREGTKVSGEERSYIAIECVYMDS